MFCDNYATTMRETPFLSAKKKRNRERLTERYYGKKALLEEWEEAGIENDYTADLRRRVRGHQNDLCYRGVDGFTELANNGSTDL